MGLMRRLGRLERHIDQELNKEPEMNADANKRKGGSFDP